MSDDSVERLRDALEDLDDDDPFVFFAHFDEDDMAGRHNVGDVDGATPLFDMAAMHLLLVQELLNEEEGQFASFEDVVGEVRARAEHIVSDRPHLFEFEE